MKTVKKLFCLLLILFTTALLVAAGYYFTVTSSVKLAPEKLLLSQQNVTLYDAENRPMKSAFSDFKQSVCYADIPKKTVLAFVDTEDKRFFSHHGFDWKRIAKAAYNNARAHSFKQGASTISQQLIKNTHLSQEKTLNRKLKEWKLTRFLERKYSKEEILEKYLNVIYFGHNCFGIHAAASFYFGKQPQELDLADSAILAGLVKSPNNYSPFKHPENCQKRKASVLNAMLKNGSITHQEKQEAIDKPLPVAPNQSVRFDYIHAVFDELSYLSEQHGFTIGGNIEISTYADPSLQSRLEQLAGDYNDTDLTLATLNPKNNGFKAYVSTVGNIPRLPGSLLKPLLVYGPALEKDVISPATPLLDEKIDYGGYSPENYDEKFHGYVSARESLANSLNIPAVKLLESVGTKTAAGYLEKMSLEVEKDDLSLALALGGMKKGYTLQQLLSAYSTLVNGGNFSKSGFISKIVIDGIEVYRHNPPQTRVFSEESAYLLTDMLQTAAKTGTAKKLRTLPFQIAAKTGTVGTNKGNTDAYAVSYTTNDVVGVWLGNADNAYINCTGGGLPCNYLLAVNEYLQERYQQERRTIENFPAPKTVVRVALDKASYYDTHTILLADEFSPINYRFTELFKNTSVPTKTSTFFSNPTIITPNLQFTDGKVIIRFDESSPTCYQYKIDKYDYATHTTVYLGDYIPTFTDEDVLKNKRYVYTITPIYQDRRGQEIQLPTVSTNVGERPPAADKEILNKDWWEY